MEGFFWWSDHEVRKKSGSSRGQEMPGRPPQPWGSRKGAGWKLAPSLPFPSSTPRTPLGSPEGELEGHGEDGTLPNHGVAPQWAREERREPRGKACWSAADLGWEPAWTEKRGPSRNHKLRLLLMWQRRHSWQRVTLSGSLV